MVTDKQAEVISESIRRMASAILEEGLEVELISSLPCAKFLDPEEVRRIAARIMAIRKLGLLAEQN